MHTRLPTTTVNRMANRSRLWKNTPLWKNICGICPREGIVEIFKGAELVQARGSRTRRYCRLKPNRGKMPVVLPLAIIAHGGERRPVTFVAFKAIDPVLCGQGGGFDSHTLPPKT